MITIIVLLILAGVTVATLTGDNGILERTKTAKETTDNSKNEENERIAGYESEIDNYLTRLGNGALQSTILYPNGTAENPAIITANQRIEVDNPYEGHTVYCIAQIQYNGKWGETGWVYGYGGGYGVKASHLLGENYDKIIIQTGSNGLCSDSWDGGSPFGITGGIVSPPYRVIVVCLD